MALNDICYRKLRQTKTAREFRHNISAATGIRTSPYFVLSPTQPIIAPQYFEG